MDNDEYTPLNNWWPVRPLYQRRGRSQAGYTFNRASIGPVIRSQHPYAFVDSLMHENELVMLREDSDPVYRGDVLIANTCVLPLNFSDANDAGTDTEDGEEEVQEWVRPDSPAGDDASVTAVAPSSPAERLSSPETPLPARINTYLKRDKKRVHDQREAEAKAKREVEKRDAVLKAELRRTLRRIQLERPDPLPIRRSHRLGQVRLQGRADAGRYTAEKLIGWGHEVHTWVDDLPRPLIDKHNKVMAVVAGAPKGDEIFWGDINERATKDATRLRSRGEFSLSNQEQFVQFGVGFGEIFRSPHILSGTPDTNREIEYLQASPAWKAMSAYHNHLYQQFAPDIHAQVQSQVNEFLERRILTPPFPNSVFTTAEINFCDAGTGIARKNYDSSFGTMEAITSLGFYNHKKGGQCEVWDDEAIIELAPGATIVFPAGTKRFSFLPVGKNETRYLFRQFCHASVFRWLEKGGRADTEFDRTASPAQITAWDQMRLKRGEMVAKRFSKLDDIFVI